MPKELIPEKLILRQGTKNCWYLAQIDCLYAAGEAGRKRFQNLFTQTSSGHIVVRLKHPNAELPNLKKAQESGKYHVEYDSSTNEIVVTISARRIQELEQTCGGVESNSLGVIILEHLLPYFCDIEWSNFKEAKQTTSRGLARSNSMEAYPCEASSSAPLFLGRLMGIPILESQDLDRIIQIKEVFPDEPIYISMFYTEAHHALRIARIERNPNNSSEYNFRLVNPWNNQKTEVFNSENIRRRMPRFAIYNINPHRFSIITLLYQHPFLLNIISQIKVLNPKWNPMVALNPLRDTLSEIVQHLKECEKENARIFIVKFAEKLRGFPLNYANLNTEDEVESHRNANINRINQLLKNDPQYQIAAKILNFDKETHHPIVAKATEEILAANNRKATEYCTNIRTAKRLIDTCVDKINAFPIPILPDSLPNIDICIARAYHQLEAIVISFLRIHSAENLLRCQTIQSTLAARHKIIAEAARLQKARVQLDPEVLFREISFNHLLSIVNHEAFLLDVFTGKHEGTQSLYAMAASKLYEALNQAKIDYFHSTRNQKEKIQRLAISSSNAILNARRYLGSLREWAPIRDAYYLVRNAIEMKLSSNSSRLEGPFFKPYSSCRVRSDFTPRQNLSP